MTATRQSVDLSDMTAGAVDLIRQKAPAQLDRRRGVSRSQSEQHKDSNDPGIAGVNLTLEVQRQQLRLAPAKPR